MGNATQIEKLLALSIQSYSPIQMVNGFFPFLHLGQSIRLIESGQGPFFVCRLKRLGLFKLSNSIQGISHTQSQQATEKRQEVCVGVDLRQHIQAFQGFVELDILSQDTAPRTILWTDLAYVPESQNQEQNYN